MEAEPQVPQKRASLTPDALPAAKRQRTDSPSTTANVLETPGTFPVEEPLNDYHVNRQTLQRSIGLALEQVGFDGASDEALESFTLMTETFLTSLCADVMSLANHARRSISIPTDFELAFHDFHISQKKLRRQRHNAIPSEKIKAPERATDQAETKQDRIFKDLPYLSEELSGKGDKQAKTYIPSFLPDFPSTHTYKYTPVDIESVTVRQPIVETTRNANAPPAPDWRGDPKKIREAAAVQAKQAEEALRKLVRASKMASLKDLRSTAEKNPAAKKRYDLWEDAMKEMLADKGGLSHGRDGAGREDVADHSMMVNAQKKFHRQEVQRSGRKKIVKSLAGKG